jgi:hypothetical protein
VIRGSRARIPREKCMNRLSLIIIFSFAFGLTSPLFGVERPVLARVTVYWKAEGSGLRAFYNGARLRDGHCAVDSKKIPFGSKVIFPDATCVAVDTGPDVVNRKAARQSGRNKLERAALVVDRFFETKSDAMAWVEAHSPFMTLQIVPPASRAKNEDTLATNFQQRCDVRAMFES